MVQYRKHLTKITPVLSYKKASQNFDVPLIGSTKADTSKGMVEENFMFPLEKDVKYIFIVQYQGEIPQHQPCEYYNTILSINTVQRMVNELSCLTEKPG